MTGNFRFIGDRPMNLRGRDGLVYSFKPGDITDELASVVVKFPRLFSAIEEIVETPAQAEALAEVTPSIPVVEADGAGEEGAPEVLTDTDPDVPTAESNLPTGAKADGAGEEGAPEVLTDTDPDKSTVESEFPTGDENPKPEKEATVVPEILTEVTDPSSGKGIIDGLHTGIPMNILRELGKELGVKTGHVSKETLITSIREAKKNENP